MADFRQTQEEFMTDRNGDTENTKKNERGKVLPSGEATLIKINIFVQLTKNSKPCVALKGLIDLTIQ